LLQGEALKYGVDLEGSHFEQDEPVRVPGAKDLHTEAGTIRSDSPDSDPESKGQPETEDIPPHMPHARWETAVATTTTAMPSLESGGFVFKWLLGEWSKCSQECGAAGSGLQVS